MNFIELAKERYSVRKFSDKEVEKEKIDKIIEAAKLAPTAVNFQPFKVFVFESKEAKDKLDKLVVFPFVKEAPLAIIVGADKKVGWVRNFDRKSFAEVDASIVATHIMLEVADLGLGTTWCGHFDEELLKKNFPELYGYDLVCLFPIGYPADDAKPSNTHSVSKNDDVLVKRL